MMFSVAVDRVLKKYFERDLTVAPIHRCVLSSLSLLLCLCLSLSLSLSFSLFLSLFSSSSVALFTAHHSSYLSL